MLKVSQSMAIQLTRGDNATLMVASAEQIGTLTIVNDGQQKIGIYDASNTLRSFDHVIAPGREYTYNDVPAGNMFGIVGINKDTIHLESDGSVGIMNYTCYDIIASPYVLVVSMMDTNATITIK